MDSFRVIRERLRERFYRRLMPVQRILVSSKIHPDLLSVGGLLSSILSGLFFGGGSFFWAAVFLAISGLCDAFDGTVAREQGRSSRRGAFLDSSLDRLGEIAVFSGLVAYFARIQEDFFVVLLVIGLGGSMMISYTRARAEGLGLECKVGFFQRPERFVLLIAGALLGLIPLVGIFLLKGTIILITILSLYTTIERMRYILSLWNKRGES